MSEEQNLYAQRVDKISQGVQTAANALSSLLKDGDGSDYEVQYSVREDSSSVTVRKKRSDDEVHVQIPALPISTAELEQIRGAVTRICGRVQWLADMTHGDVDAELSSLYDVGVSLVHELSVVFKEWEGESINKEIPNLLIPPEETGASEA